ncbi:MAG: HlyD family efflux transporter periplasmic adaptor subunit [Actinobacteria bacterium]|jgi:multidrug efflux pump subunit AcrA (membrane-fusion protein)|nr:HlyD family efflux transporter periplasmic adaptor subunit [Actinomycetota bacterium]MBT3686570.1 HlyD family efflux transporter periplasmic adaptor subunit [Actinomycetota bacterium]MBT4038342.1 HlyD family efflux transporter periplasmic adaptor subunit [Actinomycetota bacterium]MBT4279436.1 HlyD family efflux transporter periplasmic adaptor subunit [Actinomycetota bacterium]MBT4343578.1 HlyD family efflux transporter periplasmic adaptor subunit [Actinomycetota bacterium]
MKAGLVVRIFALVVAAAVVAGLTVWKPWDDSGTAVDPLRDRAIAEAVTTRTLTEELTVRGELRRDELQTINSAASGRITGLEVADGDTVQVGDVLFSLDGRRAVAVGGDLEFYRPLDVGSDGPDVLQLEKVLSAAGYSVGVVDRYYTEETRSGLAEWQSDHDYGSTATEVDEVVTVSLQANPAGYSVGAVNTVSVQIGGASRSVGKARRNTAEDITGAPVVTVRVVEAIVTEGDQVVFTVTADPIPASDLVVAVRIGGDVTSDDYEGIDDTVVIAAGSATANLVVTTQVDDLREANEDLEVTVSSSFDEAANLASQDLLVFDIQEALDALLERQAELVDEIVTSETAPEDLVVFDLQTEIDDLVERRAELVSDVAEAQQDLTDAEAEVSGLESRQQEKTDVEQELMDKGIITLVQTVTSDVTPAEAANLISLDEALDDANADLEAENITVAARTQAFDAYYDALSAALEESTELTTARDTVDTAGNALASLEREDDRLSFLLEVAEADLAEAQASTDTVVQDLLDEQRRLEFSLDAKREELRVAQGSRYLVGDPDTATVIIDDPDVADAPTLVLRSDSETVVESGLASFTVETPDPLVEDLEIFYETVGSATAGSDYNQPDGDVILRAGQESVAITVQLRPDDLVEDEETITVRLLDDPSGNYLLSHRSEATVRVASADLPELTLAGGGWVSEGATTVVTVVADQAATVDTSINYSIGGSARAGEDFEVLTGTTILRTGESSVDIPIRSIADDVVFLPGDMVVAQWPARVGSVHVEAGHFVQSGTPLLTLTEPNFTVKLFATPSNRAKLDVGQSVTVNMDAGDQEVGGLIAEIDDSATSEGGSETYEGVVQTDSDLVGVDGAVVTIDAVVAESVDAVVVPIAAVLSDGGDQKVRVVTPAGVIERRSIQTGMLDGAYVEIISGLSVGEYVILEIDRS